MFEDVQLMHDHSWDWTIPLNWICTFFLAIFSIFILLHIRSKTPARQTVMDCTSTIIISQLVYYSILLSVTNTVHTLMTDCGHHMSSYLAWSFFTVSTDLELEVLLHVLVQICMIRRPWLLKQWVTFEFGSLFSFDLLLKH